MTPAIAIGSDASPKYDAVTRWSHAALAIAVVADLALLSVMRVPAGPGLGVRDWHREAFELHCRIGPVVALFCGLHWLWISLPWARPGVGYLFPWLSRRRNRTSPLVGTVQGLGLCAVTASVIGGSVSYLGYFTHVPVSARVLHWCALELIVSSYLVWTFVIGHGLMALIHTLAAHARLAGPAAQRPGAS